MLDTADVVIDFSQPLATEATLARAARRKSRCWSARPAMARRSPTSLSAPRATLPCSLLPTRASVQPSCCSSPARPRPALPVDFDAEIIESHHRLKKDAPSGTALALGAAVAQGRGGQLTDIAVMNRRSGAARRAGEIGFAVVRGGDLVGEHTLLFAGDGEALTLSHRASDRGVFARGALRAAVWLTLQPPGRYGMGDVLPAAPGC